MMKQFGIVLLFAVSMGCKGPGGPPGGGGRSDASAADFVTRLDADGDGSVSESEFDGPAEHFAELDKNSDGLISGKEAPTGPPPGGDRR